MPSYLQQARHHVARIQYLHKYARVRAYTQASPHYQALTDLALRAERSTSRTSQRDSAVITALIHSIEPLMAEIRLAKIK